MINPQRAANPAVEPAAPPLKAVKTPEPGVSKTHGESMSRKQLRSYGLIMAGMFGGLFGLSFPLLFGRPFPIWPWCVAGPFLVLGLLAPAALGPVYVIWMKIGHVLGWINTRIILGILYYTVLLCVGLVMRALGKDPMNRKFDPNAKSYRLPSHETTSTQEMERPY